MTMNGMSYDHDNWVRKIVRPGYKMYLSSVQADVASRNFETYEAKLQSLELIRDAYNAILGLNNTSNHLYRVEVEGNKKVQAELKEKNISTGIHYAALHELGVYASQTSPYLHVNDCTLSSKHAKRTLSIPFHERLSLDDVTFVCEAIKPYL